MATENNKTWALRNGIDKQLSTEKGPALLGGAFASAARAYSAATLPAAPVVVRVHPFGHNAFTTNAGTGGTGAIDYVDGALCLAPGTAITLQELATTTSSTGIMSITWCEIPL